MSDWSSRATEDYNTWDYGQDEINQSWENEKDTLKSDILSALNNNLSFKEIEFANYDLDNEDIKDVVIESIAEYHKLVISQWDKLLDEIKEAK